MPAFSRNPTLAPLCGGAAFRVAAWPFIAGIALFTGRLYLLAIGAPRDVGATTPFGGIGS